MLSLEELKPTKKNTEETLDLYLRELDTNKASKIEYYSALIEKCYRNLAVLSYLVDGAIDEFHHKMYLAAAMRMRYIACIQESQMPHDKLYLCATRDAAIYEALASGGQNYYFSLAGLTLTLVKDPAFDTEETYLRTLLLRSVVIAADNKDSGIIDENLLREFDTIREEENEPWSALFWALKNKQAKDYEAALYRLIKNRKKELEKDEHDENVEFGERWVFVEGLAMIRIGNLMGLRFTINDPIVPKELQEAPKTPFPLPKSIWPRRPDHFS